MPKSWILLTFLMIFSISTIHAQTTRHTVVHDDITRSYRVYVPDHYDDEQDGQLILVLHGGNMSGLEMVALTGGALHDLIDAHMSNAIVVYPDGFGNGWNDGRIIEGRVSYDRGIDDSGFLVALIDTLADDYHIDPNGVYITGFSNGAGMAYRFACDYSERVNAIAPVANLIPSTFVCDPSEPVGVTIIIGDQDPVVPLTGGDLFYWDTSLGSVLSLDDTLALWHDVNQCDGYDDAVYQPDIDPDDGTETSIQYAQDCTKTLNVLMIHGGGHTWAGATEIFPEDEYGLTTYNVDASAVAFSLFLTEGLNQK